METVKISGRDFPVLGHVTVKHIGTVPLVDLPMMSNYEWQMRNLQDRLEHPEVYREILVEDVEAVCAGLREWLRRAVQE